MFLELHLTEDNCVNTDNLEHSYISGQKLMHFTPLSQTLRNACVWEACCTASQSNCRKAYPKLMRPANVTITSIATLRNYHIPNKVFLRLLRARRL